MTSATLITVPSWSEVRAGLLALVLCLFALEARAELAPQYVAEGVWALVGAPGAANPDNLGNNATFGVVATADGAVVIDAGGSHAGGREIQALAEEMTGQPVIAVINTGSRDQAWLGNGWFADQDIRILAHRDAVADQRRRQDERLWHLRHRVGAAAGDTRPVTATETLNEDAGATIGGVRFEFLDVGPAQGPGDLIVWLPGPRIAFAGGVVSSGRLPAITEGSDTANWLRAFDRLYDLAPRRIVPGHGAATTRKTARRDTRDYIAWLRNAIGAIVRDGGSLARARILQHQQPPHLADPEHQGPRNIARVFEELAP